MRQLAMMQDVGELVESVAGVRDLDLGRELVVALVALCVFVFTSPRGRRWLAWAPAALLVLAPLPLAMAALFPDSAEAPRMAVYGIRFFLLASLLQSVLLVAVVSIWERLGRPIPKIFLDVLRLLTAAVALVVILFEAGVHAQNLFTGSAVVTAVLGFALKDTLGNVFAGLAVHAEHPFELGDWIQYDANPAHIGKVVEINWRATRVLTLDEAHVTIPNSQLAQASIRNFTKPEPWSRRSLYVVTPYEVSPQRVQAIILDAIQDSFGVLRHPAPSVVTNDFKDRGVEHWVRFFTTEFDKRDRVDGMARDRIWYALARHGIEIPVATQSIRLTPLPPREAEPADAAVARRAAALRAVGLLEAFSAEELQALAERSADRVYAAGEPIVRQGDPGGSMFVILSGGVDVTVREADGAAAHVAALAAGDYFGEVSLITGTPRVATVTAIAEVRVVEVGKDSFQRLLAAKPALVDQLGRALERRLAERSRAVAGIDRSVPEGQDIFQKIREFFGVE